MGLDMYLYKKEKHADKRYKAGYRYDTKNLAYWRKANAIRGWLVANEIIQEDDDCVERCISREQIKHLIDDCNIVIGKYNEDTAKAFTNVAESTMPRTSGFFFGSNDYSDCYINELKDTVSQLTTVLENTTDNDNLVYSDWW